MEKKEEKVSGSGYEGEVKETKAVSSSKQKRLDRAQKVKKAKTNDVLSNVIWAVIGVVIVAGIIALIATGIYKSSQKIVASNDYSGQLNDNGFIKGVKANDYISLCDYKNIVVPLSEVEYPEEKIKEDFEAALESHKVLLDEGIIFNGDTVNIDYVGTIDGEEFDGGSSNGSGYDLVIGSGSFIDDFEQQLIGYKVGETVNVEVTFPENYATTELAGKDAVFEVVINGIYFKQEMTDEFVAENLSEFASTVEEYRQYLKDANYEDALVKYLQQYLADNSNVIKTPKKYLKNVIETTMYSDQETYQQMNQMYMQFYGQGFNSFEEYSGMTPDEYQADLDTRANATVKSMLIQQAILENEGITITEEEVTAYINDTYGSTYSYESLIEEYGKGYIASELMSDKVLEIVKGYAKVQ